MASRRPIPSPEEIQRIVAAHEAGESVEHLLPQEPPPKPPEPSEAEKVKKSLERRINNLQRRLTAPKKRRTAAERQEALDTLREEYDFSAAEELIKLAIDLEGEPDKLSLRVSILEKLIEYEVPKLKSMEISGEVDVNHNISIIRFGDDGSVKQEKLQAPGSQGDRTGQLVGASPIDAEIVREVANG